MSSQARARNPDTAEEGQAVVSSDNLITQEHSMQLVENLRKFYEDERCFLYVRHDGVTEGPRDDGPVMQEMNRTTGDETVSVLVVVLI